MGEGYVPEGQAEDRHVPTMGTAAWGVKAWIPSRAVGKHLQPHQKKRDLGQEVILIQTSSWE